MPDDSPPLRLEFDIVAEPRGKVYVRLLETLWLECPLFSLVYRFPAPSAEIAGLRERLIPSLVHEERVTRWPGTQLLSLRSADKLPVLAMYQATELARSLLLEPKGLYQWKDPRRPEDLALYDASGQLWLGTVAHERLGRLSVPVAFEPRLKAIPNLRLAVAREGPWS